MASPRRAAPPTVTLSDAVLACVPTYERMEAADRRLVQSIVKYGWKNTTTQGDIMAARQAHTDVGNAAELLEHMFGQGQDYTAAMRRQWLLAQLDEIDGAQGAGKEE